MLYNKFGRWITFVSWAPLFLTRLLYIGKTGGPPCAKWALYDDANPCISTILEWYICLWDYRRSLLILTADMRQTTLQEGEWLIVSAIYQLKGGEGSYHFLHTIHSDSQIFGENGEKFGSFRFWSNRWMRTWEPRYRKPFHMIQATSL